MTQPPLDFDTYVQGATPRSRHTGWKAAQQAQTRRGRLVDLYLRALQCAGAGGLTDHEAAVLVQCPIQSICSTRGNIRKHGLADVVDIGERPGPYGAPNTVRALRETV